MSAFHEQVRESLPRLTPDNCRITSSPSWEYNCIAWAVGVNDGWWWPVPGRYWPPDVPREETVGAFLAMLAARGYAPFASAKLETGIEKIALYALGDDPTHAARQVASGWWTSKLGPSVDIEHTDPEAVAGGVYGKVVAIVGRNTVSQTQETTMTSP